MLKWTKCIGVHKVSRKELQNEVDGSTKPLKISHLARNSISKVDRLLKVASSKFDNMQYSVMLTGQSMKTLSFDLHKFPFDARYVKLFYGISTGNIAT